MKAKIWRYGGLIIAVGLSGLAAFLFVNYVIEGYTPLSRITAALLAIGFLGIAVEILRPYVTPYINKMLKGE